ncbi:hypothetical protein QTP70_014050 [Hemibagrus guttatus]|uniref:Reverse transcriptase domain-containing protein n=1 Tax=Hemibagrus guttatus TaxID=175788 RepID=A0AAE0R413_9TELE|nr:hypothetical protein QTP70_014050 [Hemibagrus guttatus]KAK3569046.1 hypothetical protein QTP86_021547 [Hemibagrus guttatus]
MCVYNYQKPWMNSEVHLLLKAGDAAFKSGDTEDYSRARANLKRGIRKAKHAHKLRLKEHFHNNSNPRRMWKGIQTITDHKPSIQSLPTSNAFLPDELNHFFARFDKGIIHHTRNADPSTAVHPISLSTTEVHSDTHMSEDYNHYTTGPHLIACLPPTLDPHQFAYHPNRSTEDAISTAIHLALTHLDNNNTYFRMLFIDFSSAFNTVVPSKLTAKLRDLGICTSICNCIMDFLTNRPQSVRLGNHISSTLILNTGVPQGCVLRPLLYSLFTHDCVLWHNSNIFIKYEDDTTVDGRISNNNESAYREEIQSLSAWCSMNNLTFNAMKTKEFIVDFRKSNSSRHSPIYINGSEIEHVSSFKFLGVHISEDLSWHLNISTLVRKVQQRLYFLRLKKVHPSPKILTNFYHCIIEGILTSSITVWYGSSTVCERKSLQRVVKTTQSIISTQLPAIESLHHSRCLLRAHKIIKDSSHPSHKLFNLLPSRRRYRTTRTRTSRFRASFFHTTINLLNSTLHH